MLLVILGRIQKLKYAEKGETSQYIIKKNNSKQYIYISLQLKLIRGIPSGVTH